MNALSDHPASPSPKEHETRGQAHASEEEAIRTVPPDWWTRSGWAPGWTPRICPARGEPVTSSFISGGASNEIFEITGGDFQAVLRRPPRVVPKGRNETMLREYRVLHALNGTDVPHPEAYAACERRPGDRVVLLSDEPGGRLVPHEHGRVAGTLRHRSRGPATGSGIELVDGIARLARVDWRARGLEGFGKPDGFHDRQVDRWMAHLDAIEFRDIPGLDVTADWLRAPQAEPLGAGHHPRRLPVRQRDVRSRGPGPAGRHGRLGDVDGR